MKRSLVWSSAFALVMAVCLGGPGTAQAQEMDEAMAMMMKLATPGEHHQHLKAMEGTWKGEGTFWMQPGAEAIKSTGTMKNTMVMGGRFLQSEYEGEFLGQGMVGFGLEGYDNFSKKHTGLWTDTMGTMMMISEGGCSAAEKSRTLVTEFADPVSGQMTKMKMVTTVNSPTKHTMVGWTEMPGAEPYKSMEIVYTKQ